jgi:hypothetical protein
VPLEFLNSVPLVGIIGNTSPATKSNFIMFIKVYLCHMDIQSRLHQNVGSFQMIVISKLCMIV